METGTAWAAGPSPAGRAWRGLVLHLVETGTDTRGHGIDVLELNQPREIRDVANLG